MEFPEDDSGLWGRAFSPRSMPFAQWIRGFEHSRLFFLVWLLFLFICCFVAITSNQASLDQYLSLLKPDYADLGTVLTVQSFRNWASQIFNSWDLHYSFSMVAVILFLNKKRVKKDWALWESSFFLVMNLLALFIASFFWSVPGLRLAGSEGFLSEISVKNHLPLVYYANWLEPVILTLGIVCLYHVLKRNSGSIEAGQSGENYTGEKQ